MAAINESNYVDEAEKVILALKGMKNEKGRPIPLVTTSQIRNLLSLTADIYNEVIALKTETLDADIKARIDYLRVRFLYEAGRNESVKKFVEETGSLEFIKGIKDRKRFILFNRYMEALVAFHKYYGGRD